MDNLSRFALFVQVVETGSFVAAGRQLGISASAVGKSVTRLEERLGVSLFRRSTRSISLTEEGEIFLNHCRRILTEIDDIELELSRRMKQPKGKLKITMPLVNQLLLPVLAKFGERFPEIELDLDFSDRIVDVVNEGFDAAVRTGDLSDSRLMTRRLGSFRMMLVAAPAYLAAQGRPDSATELADHACLRHKWLHSGKLEDWPIDNCDIQIPTTIVSNNIEALIYFVRDGRGIACLPDFAVRDDIANGDLVHILPDDITNVGTFRILWPASKHMSPRIRALVDFMVSTMATSFVAQGEMPSTRLRKQQEMEKLPS